MKRFLLVLVIIGAAFSMYAADIKGIVLDDKGEPLPGANVYWRGTAIGVTTDPDGTFVIKEIHETDYLVSSFIGYTPDTTRVQGQKDLTIVLVSDLILDEVTITERKMGVLRSRVAAFDTQTIGADEMCKAACCNLSEAFETSASVDVAYADAATGAKQIKLLGLSGTYVQLLMENTPGVRGLAQNFGLEYIPGSWMQSIQVSKGTSSVINGYEAVSGQINVELLKPQTQNPLSINLMVNSELMAEANIEGGWQIPLKDHDEEHDAKHEHDEHCHHESLYTGVMAHYGGSFMTMDENKDGFADMPKVQNANLANRWFYRHGDYTLIAYVRGLYDRRRGGQMSDTLANPYRINLNNWRVEGFLKNGYVYDDESGSSIALVTSLSYHNLDNTYGLRHRKAHEWTAHLNALWQGNFEGSGEVDNDHRLNAGLSVNMNLLYDWLGVYKPDRTGYQNGSAQDFSHLDVTPGIFAEYNFKYDEMLSLVAGVRADWSPKCGFFFTPRMNIRYTPFEWWTLRASAGMGYRTPYVLADNAFVLPSSRALKFDRFDGSGTDELCSQHDIRQERAVNTGISTTFYIPIGGRQLQLSAEYYYTHFLNSLIVDMDRDPHAVYFYNQQDMPNGKSFAHCAQVEATMEVLRGWTWTAAFRWTDIEQTTFNATTNQFELRPKALTNRFKGVITTSYQTPLKKWQFDVTAQFNGISRMPDGFTAMGDLTGGYSTPKQLRWYPQLMAQVTKYFRTCSLYIGAENMTNFRQDNPIIGADDPYGTDFDASMAWGPITGWKVYAGFRWSLDKKE